MTGHSYIVFGPLANATTGILYEGAPDTPDWDRWWEIVEDYGVTILYTAPTAIRAFMKQGEEHPRRHDLSSLRLVVCGGSAVPRSLIERFPSPDKVRHAHESSVERILREHRISRLTAAQTLEILKSPPLPVTEGVVVECGCYLGGSTANLSLICQAVGRELIVYDSFEGLPAGDANDSIATAKTSSA